MLEWLSSGAAWAREPTKSSRSWTPAATAIRSRCSTTGYVYLATTRLSLFRSPEDWALVIEVFGFSPRQGTPSTDIQTFASRLHDRDPPDQYVTRKAYENYLANHPHSEFRSVYPFGQIDWEDEECVVAGLDEVELRGRIVRLPAVHEYAQHGIDLVDPARVHLFELCRYFAAVAREDVLATPTERRVSMRPEMKQILLLDEWHHPNVVTDDRPSRSQTFRQLAQVLETGDVTLYGPTETPNTQWRNWPAGGTL